MQTDKEFYFSAGLYDIPWGRLVNWYGRSTDFPACFHDMLSDDPEKQKAAIGKIEMNIEHQDGIMMATPFALLFLFRLLAFDQTDKKQILKTILAVVKAAKFQTEYYEGQEIENKISHIQELLDDQYIWPEFESEDQDEMHWEEFEYGDEHYYWLKYIFEIAKAHSFILTKFTDQTEIDTAKEIINLLTETDNQFK
ncbi:hypothetical protein [Chryseobacterium sp. 2987]|uniref:hypothetical protein n=1 Tax=Chryseobacterium sp. 2987 TaxID=2817767 RepID=UPI00285C3D2A|nr:hypothetical protein [Chryseobacterium sp. 2987]MDR6923374.1 hypothetical protein [Chryseobacterium sp. 2987]